LRRAAVLGVFDAAGRLEDFPLLPRRVPGRLLVGLGRDALGLVVAPALLDPALGFFCLPVFACFAARMATA